MKKRKPIKYALEMPFGEYRNFAEIGKRIFSSKGNKNGPKRTNKNCK